MGADAVETIETPKRSSRDLASVRERLEAWLATRVPEGGRPEVSEVTTPGSSGMSSETLLFDAFWHAAGRRQGGGFVARVRPDPADVPVFPVYDLEAQVRVMRLVRDHTDVPVPSVRWLETDASFLGAPFFVMERVEGRVPPDVMPYTMGSWLQGAAPADQRRLQDATVGLLAKLHAIDPSRHDLGFLAYDTPGDTALRRHVAHTRRYYEWARGGRRFPLIERTFDWLEAHWPEETPAVLSWGDSRIGNVLYDGFTPVAALDWEMAALGPRELDVGWLVFLHVFFQHITEQMGLPGMPDFLRREDVVATYREHGGVALADLGWFEAYTALRHAIVLTRTHARQVHFGEAEWPEDPDTVIYHRAALERWLETGAWR